MCRKRNKRARNFPTLIRHPFSPLHIIHTAPQQPQPRRISTRPRLLERPTLDAHRVSRSLGFTSTSASFSSLLSPFVLPSPRTSSPPSWPHLQNHLPNAPTPSAQRHPTPTRTSSAAVAVKWHGSARLTARRLAGPTTRRNAGVPTTSSSSTSPPSTSRTRRSSAPCRVRPNPPLKSCTWPSRTPLAEPLLTRTTLLSWTRPTTPRPSSFFKSCRTAWP